MSGVASLEIALLVRFSLKRQKFANFLRNKLQILLELSFKHRTRM